MASARLEISAGDYRGAVASPSTSRSRMRNNCRRRKRANITAEGMSGDSAARYCASRSRKLLGGQRPMQVTAVDHLQQPLRTAQHGLRQEIGYRKKS